MMIGERYYPVLVAAFGTLLLFVGSLFLYLFYTTITTPTPAYVSLGPSRTQSLWEAYVPMLTALGLGTIMVIYAWSLVRHRISSVGQSY